MISRFLFVPALVFSAAVLGGCGGSDESAATTDESPVITISVAPVELVTLPRHQLVPATARPAERASIAAKVLGAVTEIPAVLGQRVRAGDVLVLLTAPEIHARLDRARAAAAQAAGDLAREQSLLGKGASTAELVRSLEDAVRMARAAVAEAEAMAAYLRVTAPFDGVVTGRFVNPGDLASPGVPLLAIEATEGLRAEAEIPESLAGLAPGAELAVFSGDERIAGKLAELSPAAQRDARTRLAKIDLPSGAPVRSGQFVRVEWPAGEASALLAPAGAVSLFGQMERVFVVRDGRAHLRIIKTGPVHGERVEILAGLAAGEVIVLAPPSELRGGHRVEIRP